MPLEDMIFLHRLYMIQPFGYRRDEFNTGLLCSFIMNSQRATRQAKVWSALDCMPLTRRRDDFDDMDEDEINERNLAVMRSLARGSR